MLLTARQTSTMPNVAASKKTLRVMMIEATAPAAIVVTRRLTRSP